MSKYANIADTIVARLQHGDYRLRGFPSHTGLTDELGVNARTVSKALDSLVQRGILVRHESGRIDVRKIPASEVRHIGVLSPAWPSENIMKWHRMIQLAAEQRGWVVKPVLYSHWHDIAITESLRGMDGVFFISLGDDFPQKVLDQMKTAENTRTVILEQDLSKIDFPSLRYYNPASINQLVEHLNESGYRKVACLNTQPQSSVIRDRIDAWHLWSSALNVEGPLIDEPVELYESATQHAYNVVTRFLKDKPSEADALLCTTPDIAIGATRAVVDAGLCPGRDIGICSVEDWTGESHLLCPSITSLKPPSITPLLNVCLDYFDGKNADWVGPRLIQPSSMELCVGESTSRDTQIHA